MSIFDLLLLFNLYSHTRYISYTIFLNDVEEGGELVFPLAKHKYKVRKFLKGFNVNINSFMEEVPII